MEISYDDLNTFADEKGDNILDNVMPIGIPWAEQKLVIAECKHEDKYVESYRITDKPHGGGNHGWYCTCCGKVVQYG